MTIFKHNDGIIDKIQLCRMRPIDCPSLKWIGRAQRLRIPQLGWIREPKLPAPCACLRRISPTLLYRSEFMVSNAANILIPLDNQVRIHNVWEFWAYGVLSGILLAPWYAFWRTMMAELTPPGFENMFFSLFGLTNRAAASMVGPNVVQAITVDKTGDN